MTFNKHQVNLFVGSQSYIFRSNSEKEVKKLTGLKTLDANSMADFLSKLNDQVFGAELGGSFKREERRAMAKAARGKMEYGETAELEPPKHLDQIRERLKKMGAKTKAAELKLLRQKVGISVKRLEDLKPAEAQVVLIGLLRGKK